MSPHLWRDGFVSATVRGWEGNWERLKASPHRAVSSGSNTLCSRQENTTITPFHPVNNTWISSSLQTVGNYQGTSSHLSSANSSAPSVAAFSHKHLRASSSCQRKPPYGRLPKVSSCPPYSAPLLRHLGKLRTAQPGAQQGYSHPQQRYWTSSHTLVLFYQSQITCWTADSSDQSLSLSPKRSTTPSGAWICAKTHKGTEEGRRWQAWISSSKDSYFFPLEWNSKNTFG